MTTQRQQRVYQLAITTLLAIGGIFTSTNLRVLAQLEPDNTLGQENSIVNQVNDLKDMIEGGATRGANLFHSFEKFNVGENRSVYFANPTGIENILTRVTGGNASNIFGKLGVEGTANLFLINSNGIFFGNNASLDIRGSFTATTTDSINLVENSLFSATAPATSNLLTVQPSALFVNALKNQQATILNRGNLTVDQGKNITLFGANVTNTGTLIAPGGTVKITGTENLTIRGNIDTTTLLVDTKNLTIAENNNATIDKTTLDGLSGNTNLIFQATNDITINPLSNNSLNLVNGSGKITFTADTDGNGSGNFQMNIADIITANGRSIEIKGVNLIVGNIDTSSELDGGNITLNGHGDISTGNLYSYSSSYYGNAGNGGFISLNTNGNIYSYQQLNSSSYSYSGTAGNGGEIFLTAVGEISAESLNSSSSSYSGTAGNGGAIFLAAQSNIYIQYLLDSSSYSWDRNAGNGGAIALTAGGNIFTQYFLNSSSYSYYGNAGNGGDIFMTAQGGVYHISNESLNSSSYSYYGNAENGGDISLNSQSEIYLSTPNESLNSSSVSYSGNVGNGGDISLNAQSDIMTQSLYSFSNSPGNTGNGGAIALTTTQGDISTLSLYSYSSSYAANGDFSGNAGNGGDIALNTTGGNITTQFLESSSRSYSGNTGNGGAIAFNTTLGDISTLSLYSSSNSYSGNAGNGGAIALNTTQGHISTGSLNSSSSSDLGNAGNGGAIALNTTQGDISTQSLDSSSRSPNGNAGNGGNTTLKIFEGGINIPYIISSATGQSGNGGTIQFTGNKLDINNIVINSDGQSGSNGGLIKLDAPLIQLTDSDLSSSNYGSGNSGQIELNSTGNINFNSSRLFTTLEPGSTGEGGNIQIQTQNFNLTNFAVINTGTYSIGNAGNININAQNVSLKNGSSLQSLTADQGNAGNIFLNVPDGNIFLSNSSSISTSATKTASGNSGNIQLNSRTLSILNGSQIQALTEGIGTSKAGEIIVNASDSIIIGGIDPNFANPDPNALPGQNVGKRDYDDFGNQQILNIGTNNSILTAQQLQASDFYLNNPNQTNPNVEYNTRSPYVSLNATGDDQIHVYAINVNAGTKAVFDIDNTGLNYEYDEQAKLINFPAINTKLTLLDSQGNELSSNDDTSHGLAAGGSDTTMTLQQDPYLRYTFTQGGTYYIQVSNFDDQGVPSSYKTFSGQAITGTSYNLQISLEPNPIQANINNQGQPSGIFAYTQDAGKAGNIILNSATLTLESGGQISAFTNGSGDGGTVNINANNLVNLGVEVQNFAPVVSVETNGAGKAGDIIINTPNFTLSETARITATATKNATNTEQGGSITLNASQMNLAGVVGIFAETQGQAPAGTLKLNPYQKYPNLDITLFPNSSISASTSASGKGGDLIINAPENINITGQGKLAVESTGTGDAGHIQINTQNLNIADGVKISAATSGSGKGGNINLNANTFTANNGAQLLTTTSGTAKAGNIIVNVKDNITLDSTNTGLFANTEKGSIGDSGSITIDPLTFMIKNGAGIGVNSQGSGKGGDVSLQAGTLSLDNQAFLSAETASNQGGEINLNIQNLLLLLNNSRISATAGTSQSGGNGGNININAPFIIAFPRGNSDITANAYQGNGGEINITTNAIFGLKYQQQLTERSDITASSQFGLAGEVEINTPDVNPTSGLIELPGNLVDAESLVGKDICSAEQIAKKSSFTIIGSGGLPAESDELISNSPGMLEWATRSGKQETTPVVMRKSQVNQEEENINNRVIQEAQGWIITADGKVILTAESPKVTLQNSALTHPGCH
ncbi:filamentous hemagglutinin N-terminal domain-containing protein [Anabaena sphaerica FACHB-251]|uniref:Filamentous hemagglutinin N-terminal domain-containing protein n=1 Tax=Anabaena sphaerica FACHB-251 TaxID=2692883 RepID=A0A926ZZU1_9NOST|nr:filamentous hemagglutinin N-terminal domain-containing protein [Anabaena sphaerica]MBD2292776.1 filamentous hemagglutinin N-terminal domain-containing protein [Anabaena sphaerica FACHB-251]